MGGASPGVVVAQRCPRPSRGALHSVRQFYHASTPTKCGSPRRPNRRDARGVFTQDGPSPSRGVAFGVAVLSRIDAGKNVAALGVRIDATPGVFSPNAIHHPSGALHLASPFPPFIYAGKHCTPYLPISTMPENISPPKNNLLALKRPIARMLNQSMSHGIQMDINPF